MQLIALQILDLVISLAISYFLARRCVILLALAIYVIIFSAEMKSVKVSLILSFPRKLGSKLAGLVFKVKIPRPMRPFAYNIWIKLFSVRTEEIPHDLSYYESLQQFFNRRIDTSRREQFECEKDIIYAPADSNFSVFCSFAEKCPVKGAEFTFEELIKEAPPHKQVFYGVFYLSPGDYHDFTSFSDFQVTAIRTITGDCMPVNSAFMTNVKGVLSTNERMVVKGQFNGRNAWYVPVAALNVGDIQLAKSGLKSYSGDKEVSVSEFYQKGESIGRFLLGSTVVVCFEVEDNERVEVVTQGKIEYGAPAMRILRD